MLNKQIFEIESGKLLVKDPLKKWVGVGRVLLFPLLLFFIFCLFLFCFLFLLAFVFVVAVVVVCLFAFSS